MFEVIFQTRSDVTAVFFAACCWLFVSAPAQAIIDLNGNGMSDVWERVQNDGELFPEAFVAESDPDADGWINEVEAASGTNPFNANPPDGLIQPVIVHIPEVLGVDENEDPVVVTPEAVEVSWPTIVGKQYTLLFSLDLSSWLPVDEAFIGDGDDIHYTFLVSDADSRFWRVAATDVDTDEDGETDYEEAELAKEKYLADLDSDGLNALEEIYLGTNTHLMDTDGDGLADGDDPDPRAVEVSVTPDEQFVVLTVLE